MGIKNRLAFGLQTYLITTAEICQAFARTFLDFFNNFFRKVLEGIKNTVLRIDDGDEYIKNP